MRTIAFAAALLFAGCASVARAPQQPKPPNLVVFLVDDIGWQDLSEPFHTSRTKWNDRYATPNVERQGPGIEPYRAVRDGDYKLLWFYDGGRMELYDVVHDVGETVNLVEKRPEVAARLRAMLHAELADCEAQVPTQKDGAVVPKP